MNVQPGDTVTFTAEVRENGNPVSGQTVTFRVDPDDGGVSLSTTSATTDSNGQARTTLTTGSDSSRAYWVVAAIGNKSVARLLNVAIVETPPPRNFSISAVSDPASGEPGDPLPLTIEVQEDGSPLSGKTVTFGVSSDDGMASLSPRSATTDSNGRATTTLTLGSDLGTNTVEVSVEGIAETVTFNAVVELESLAIYWIDRGTNSIRTASLDGSSNEGIVTRGLKTPKGLALDITSGQVYWTDSGTDKIQRADLDGSNVQDLVTRGLQLTTDLALDVAGGKMYWTDSGTDKIQRADLDGSNVQDLVTGGLKNPRGLALDITNGHMYWTDKDTDKIQRAELDGSNVQDLVTRGLQLTTDLALDVMGGKMYWTDVGTGKIQRANLDGSNVEDLVTGLPGPNGIALDAAAIYWTDWRTNKIQRAELNGSNVETLVSSSLNSPSSIAVAASALPPSIDPEDETEFQAEDANRDGTVDVQDILFIAQRFNQTGQSNADVNGDEIVDVFDILAGRGCAGRQRVGCTHLSVHSYLTTSPLRLSNSG